MKLCRFKTTRPDVRIGVVAGDSSVLDLTSVGLSDLTSVLEADQPLTRLQELVDAKPARVSVAEIQLLAPVERQEVWAAGVTYLRSKDARMEESDYSANAYDRVYSAERPELFFKSLASKVVASGEPVGIRSDSTWSVPEPELALVINSHGRIVGYTVGNDMSARDVEGENVLYLPQAKIYRYSCALGPWLVVGTPEAEAREWTIQLEIRRNGRSVFEGKTSVGQIKRRFDELAAFLFRCETFPYGAVLLTGTGIVPPDEFTLRERDEIRIEISGIGVLENTVTVI